LKEIIKDQIKEGRCHGIERNIHCHKAESFLPLCIWSMPMSSKVSSAPKEYLEY
jgi:hypothetical protein